MFCHCLVRGEANLATDEKMLQSVLIFQANVVSHLSDAPIIASVYNYTAFAFFTCSKTLFPIASCSNIPVTGQSFRLLRDTELTNHISCLRQVLHLFETATVVIILLVVSYMV